MALRQFLFQSVDGFADTASLTDETQLAKITLTGTGGIALDASNQRIVNVATPTSASDAVNKSYADSIAAGFDPKASVRLATNAALPAYTPAGSGVGKTLTANANGALSVDSVAVATNDRILVKNEGGGTSADNGVYVVTQPGSAGTPFILTRALDFDQNTEVTAGAFMFVEEGTANQDQGWMLITDNPITVDTTTLTFTQFTGAGSFIAGAGILRTGNQIDVELDTGANAQGAGSGGGSSGLEFDTAGAAGKLRAAVHATGGLSRSGTGLQVLIDDTPDTLDSTAAGLKVVGLPSLFKINGTNVGANVTAPNLDTLTGAGNASALHDHWIDRESWTAAGAITKGDGVYVSANDVVSTGDSTSAASDYAKSRVIGVAEANISDTATGKIVRNGVITGVLSGATFGVRYYMAANGQPVIYSALPGSARTIQLGIAKNATDLLVRVFDYGKKP